LQNLSQTLLKSGPLHPGRAVRSLELKVADAELDALLYSDVLSRDSAHFPTYTQNKAELQHHIGALDRGFIDAVEGIEKQIRVSKISETQRRQVALSIMEQCMDLGPGITLILTQDAFQYTAVGGGNGGLSNVPADFLDAVDAFRVYRIDPSFMDTCKQLRSRSDEFVKRANELGAQARLLAEETVLHGDCGYVRLE
jgi:hypothetical protein